MMKKLMTCIVVVIAVCGVARNGFSGAANCANASGDYTLSIGGGKATVQDGETPAAFTAVVSPSTITVAKPTWSLDPLGGGEEGLDAAVLTPAEDGMSATVQFFWHPGNGDENLSCTYTLTCTTEAECVATKTITVTLPEKMGKCNGTFVCGINYEDHGESGNRIVSVYAESTYVSTDFYLLDESEFMDKAIEHEDSHETDFTGGGSSPIAQESMVVGNKWLIDNGHLYTFVTDTILASLDNDVEEYTDDLVIGPEGNTYSWTEVNAYIADSAIAPHYFEVNSSSAP